MANSYNWTIDSMDCYTQLDGYSNVVYLVRWTATASDGINTAQVSACQKIEFDAQNQFTPYDQLTKVQVMGWVISSLGEAGVKATQDGLDAHLITLASPPVVSNPLPWPTE